MSHDGYFQKRKENFENNERIMTDKDFNERNVFEVKFPNTKLLLCHFHMCLTFRREKNETHYGGEKSLPKIIIKYCI